MKGFKMKVKYIGPEDVRETLDSIGDKFFGVTFVKRTDNTVRNMNCRRQVRKGIKGRKRSTSRKTGLYLVYDMVEKGFRTINLSGVRSIRIDGVEYRIRA